MPFTSAPLTPALRQHAADGLHHRVPPVLGPLLRPLRARHLHVFVERGVSRADAAALIHQKRARAPGANVYAKPHVDIVSTLQFRLICAG